MSISYEEALATLQSMFGPPWTRESLDSVLRHHKGHMENTVDSVLGHGAGDPQALIEKLKSGAGSSNEATRLDEQVARQLDQEERRRPRNSASGQAAAAAAAATSTTTAAARTASVVKNPRGAPTTLPPDFLRVPGYNPSASTSTNAGAPSGGSLTDQDEALARMLQDELFSQELANNPEFAHLAGSRDRPFTLPRPPTGNRPPPRNNSSGPATEGPNIMEKITEMGDSAKRRLQILAAQWSAKNPFGGSNNNNQKVSGGAGGSSGAASERRGLLNAGGSEDEGDEGMEMAFARKSR